MRHLPFSTLQRRLQYQKYCTSNDGSFFTSTGFWSWMQICRRDHGIPCFVIYVEGRQSLFTTSNSVQITAKWCSSDISLTVSNFLGCTSFTRPLKKLMYVQNSETPFLLAKNVKRCTLKWWKTAAHEHKIDPKLEMNLSFNYSSCWNSSVFAAQYLETINENAVRKSTR